jgi:amidase
VPLEPAIATTLEQTIKQLLALGHEVEELTLNIDPGQLFGAHGAVIGTALRTAIHDREQVLGRAATEQDLSKSPWSTLDEPR